MKIIKHGQSAKYMEHELQCKNCECVFSATESEFRYHHDQRDGDYWTIICPEDGCGSTVFYYNLHRS